MVEDNKTNQKLLLQLLKRLGFVADVANDGLEAVEAWHKKTYDVIVRAPPSIIPRILIKKNLTTHDLIVLRSSSFFAANS